MAGLDERTRHLIGDTARALFTEHGFERITIAQIAEACEVPEETTYKGSPGLR